MARKTELTALLLLAIFLVPGVFMAIVIIRSGWILWDDLLSRTTVAGVASVVLFAVGAALIVRTVLWQMPYIVKPAKK